MFLGDTDAYATESGSAGGRESPRPSGGDPERRGILFADLQCFSRVPDDAVPGFCSDLMETIALVLKRHSDEICFRNTWGDAVVLLTRSAAGAAGIAIAMQEALRGVYCPARSGGRSSRMRISVHHGPVYRAFDPIMERTCFVGSEIIRAARIEAVTPAGEIYATRELSEVLQADTAALYATEYAGRIELPKAAGAEPLFRLSRRSAPGVECRAAEPSLF